MPRNWYPHYMGDYGRKTGHLSLMQHGAYRLLLDHCYATGADLPAEMEALYRICRAHSKEERLAVSSIVTEFFTLGQTGFSHGRVKEELARMDETSKERSKAGSKGLAKRWQNHSKKIANATAIDSNCISPAIANGIAKPLLPEPQSQPQTMSETNSVALQAKQSLDQPSEALNPVSPREIEEIQSLAAAGSLGLEGRSPAPTPPLLAALHRRHGVRH